MAEKVIIQCSGCAAKYDVSKFQPGTKFKCQKCGMINVVESGAPAAAAIPPQPTVPMPSAPTRPAPAAQTASKLRPSTAIKKPPSKFMKKPAGVKSSGATEDENGMNGIQIKKSKAIYYIIGAGVLLVIIIVIVLLSSSGGKPTTDEDEDTPKKTEKKVDKKAEAPKETPEEAGDKTTEADKKPDKPAETKEEPEKKPKKAAFAVDETAKKEVWDILKEMPNQKDDDVKKGKETIKGKGNIVIPALISAINNDDTENDAGKQIARYAADILIEMTKRQDAPNVTPLVGPQKLEEFFEDWKQWWLAHQDEFNK